MPTESTNANADRGQSPMMSMLEAIPQSHFVRVAQAWMRERPDLELGDMLLAIALMRLGRMIEHEYSKMCEDRFGVSGSEMRVLLALRRCGKPYAMRPTDLFTALVISSGAITKQVDRLVAKGLVGRLKDPTHAGGSLIQLMREGLKAVNRATDILATRSILTPILAKLPSGDRTVGDRFCHFVLAELEAAHVLEPGEPIDPEVSISKSAVKTRRTPRGRAAPAK